MAIGTNLKPIKGPTAQKTVFKALLGGLGGNKRSPGSTMPGGYHRLTNIFTKVSGTAPTTNASEDDPTGVGDLCLHYNAAVVFQDLYRCTAYTSTSVFVWTKIVE